MPDETSSCASISPGQTCTNTTPTGDAPVIRTNGCSEAIFTVFGAASVTPRMSDDTVPTTMVDVTASPLNGTSTQWVSFVPSYYFTFENTSGTPTLTLNCKG
jgi:hypothetical protein